MKQISLLLFLFSNAASAEVFHYGMYPRTIEIKSTEATLLKFDQVPIAVACQPGILEFDPVSRDQSNIREMEQIKETSANLSLEEDVVIKTMIKAKPNGTKGLTKCSFTLLGGSQVQTEFQLIDDIARPLIEFKPIHSKTQDTAKDPTLDILRSLTEGTPMMLHDVSKDYKICETEQKGQKICRNYTFETEQASYDVLYVGSNARMSAWIVSGKLKKDLTFKQVADFRQKTNAIQFSLTLPQKAMFNQDDKIKHHLIAQPNFSKKELMEVLQ